MRNSWAAYQSFVLFPEAQLGIEVCVFLFVPQKDLK